MGRFLMGFVVLVLAGTLGMGSGGAARVTITDGQFQPSTVSIRAGDTVVWVNADDRDHAIVAADGSFRSDNISPGGSFSFTFRRAGTYGFSCKLHPRERGQVVVKD